MNESNEMQDPQPNKLGPNAVDFLLTSTRPKTLANYLRHVVEPKMRRSIAKSNLSLEAREEYLQAFLRPYDPWPEWVICVAAEVISVHLPRVCKPTILDVLRAAHWFWLEATIDGPPTPAPKFGFPPDVAHDILSAVGHVIGYEEAVKNRITDSAKARVTILQEAIEVLQKHLLLKPDAAKELKDVLDQL